MDDKKLKKHIENVFKADERLWFADEEQAFGGKNQTNDEQSQNKELNQTKLIDLAENYDEKVLSLLFADGTLKEKFFVKVNDTHVFKVRDFVFFLQENKIDNSYTQYKNRIGLSDGRRFLKDNKEVVLNFPYKDCVLEGGQSAEEGQDSYFEYDEKVTATDKKKGYQENEYNQKQAKRKEIFFNEVLAADEIDRLFDEKALVNWKRFCHKESVDIFNPPTTSRIKKLNRDADGTIKENLIIKGNNLLALHSLKRQFAGKIKLIYIDPPYNTGGDANIFTYNNNFNHSTWLTFMKNRLEVARELLKDDGFIAIAIDHFELGYLIVLADEIFGRENRLGIITVRHFPGGRTNDKFFSTNNEFMLTYSKNINNAIIKNLEISSEKLKKKFNKTDGKGNYKLTQFARMGEGLSTPDVRPNLYYPIYYNPTTKDISLNKKEQYIEILPIDKKGVRRIWRNSKETFLKLLKENEMVIKNNSIFKKVRETSFIKASTIWYDGKYSAGQYGTKLLKGLLNSNQSIFSYPKSLYTVLDALKIMTDKDDIILDFHAGSGTTGHAVLALNKEDGGNRKFILVEQLDKHVDICIERNQKVLQQENIDDSFIYFELAKWNEQAKEHILACESLEELKAFFGEMVEKYFLNYNLKIKEFREKVITEEDFITLPLEKQKEMFATMLDNNQMYICRSEMDDSKFGITEKDKELTREFYNT